MTLGTHAIVGAALASLVPAHPVLGFCAGFTSHFLADTVPHYDYPIYSDAIHPHKGGGPVRLDGAFLRDASNFTLDAGLGTAAALAAFAGTAPVMALLAGAAGGILPDPLQFVSKKVPCGPLRALQRFHMWIHTSHRMRQRGELALGIISQLAFIAAVVAAAFCIHVYLNAALR